MSKRRQPLHLERTIVAFNTLRSWGVTLDQIEERLGAHGALGAGRFSSVLLRRCWARQRAIRFDPLDGHGGASELQLLEEAYPGAANAFFHPLWALLTLPLRSTESYRLTRTPVAAWVIDSERRALQRTADAAERKLIRERINSYELANAKTARSLRQRTQTEPALALDLATVHALLLQLRSPWRDVLMQPSVVERGGVARAGMPWARRSRPINDEMADLGAAPLLDRLAIGLALTIEAALTGREDWFLVAQRFALHACAAAASSEFFEGMNPSFARWLAASVRSWSGIENNLEQAQLIALPQSWVDRLSPFERLVVRRSTA